MQSTTTTRKPKTEKSSTIRKTQTTPLVTTTTATTQSTTTVTEPVSSSRSPSNSTYVHVNLTSPLAVSSSPPGELQIASSSLLVLMLFIGIFMVGVVVVLSFLLYRYIFEVFKNPL
jgi:magnesium-transporting ATPase (P-type)